ncbi:hypothetical protein FB45DRAFT_915386 [Roridomyces roridus]|uniref:Mid2 domain-containing protein n=1 Tax=Roridomyces roridus TaxID=1738132 RepID=A0AAD7BTD7_9AGAR|nr:hypothetical protein FB45DRAFT_915386 [Roridomyces roridus]
MCRPWRLAPHFLLLFIFFALPTLSTTIDDQSGDPSTGNIVSYSPSSAWMLGAIGDCSDCDLPSPGDAFLHSYHGSFFSSQGGGKHSPPPTPPTATVTFTGPAVAVICILSDSTSNPNLPSNLLFDIDGVQQGSFTHTPTGSAQFLFNQTVFARNNLTSGTHILTIQNGLVNVPSLVMLDSVIYGDGAGVVFSPTSSSTESSSPTSAPGTSSSTTPVGALAKHPNTAAIVGGVVAALAVLLLLGVAFLYMRHRRNVQRADATQPAPAGWFNGLWSSNCPRPPAPDMAPVPFTDTRPPPSVPVPTSRSPPSAPRRSPSSRLSRISFNPNLLVDRFRRPPRIVTPAERPSAPPSPALRSGNPLLNVPASNAPLDRVVSIQEWQRRTQEATANEPPIHPLDMSEVDLSSHYDESSTGGPSAPPIPPPPPPQTPQPRRFTVMNN